MSLFPAILIGGPPHSGKSVLVYSLTQALRARGVVHYALRACPDGEGDFSNETDQAVIRLVRDPGQPEGLPLPPRLRGEGLVLNGPIPNWLLTAAARQLASGFGWLAVYQPPLGGAVVVWSRAGDRLLGYILPV